jgi:hypothetical protein
VQGFLDQARRLEHALHPRQPEPEPEQDNVAQSESRASSLAMPSQSNVTEGNEEDIFDNNEDNEPPF